MIICVCVPNSFLSASDAVTYFKTITEKTLKLQKEYSQKLASMYDGDIYPKKAELNWSIKQYAKYWWRIVSTLSERAVGTVLSL